MPHENPDQNCGTSSPALHPADRIQKFFVRPFFLTLTIGLPFCTFKGLFGLAAIRAGTPSDPLLSWRWVAGSHMGHHRFCHERRAGCR